MPYKDKEKDARLNRNRKRTKKHGNWRHIIDWYNGLCASCSEEMEELHDPFGEDHYGIGKFQIRIPMCWECHTAETYANFGMYRRRIARAQYLEDISIEIMECKSYEAWCRKYNIPDGPPSRQGVLW